MPGGGQAVARVAPRQCERRVASEQVAASNVTAPRRSGGGTNP